MVTETRNAFVTVCLSPEEHEILTYACAELGQTKSTFCYVLVRDRLRALGLLPTPKPPSFNGAHKPQEPVAEGKPHATT